MGDNFTLLARRAAYSTAVLGVVYSVAFAVVVQRGAHWAQWTAAAALTAGGLVAVPVLVAVTSLLGDSPDDAASARVALMVGAIAAVMTSLHGAYDLAVLAHPQSATAGDISPVDPRGFATFALAGLTTAIIAGLARRDRRFPRWVPTICVALGAALVLTWIGRLTVLDPTSPWLRITTSVAAVLNPIVYVGFGSAIGQATQQLARRPVAA